MSFLVIQTLLYKTQTILLRLVKIHEAPSEVGIVHIYLNHDKTHQAHQDYVKIYSHSSNFHSGLLYNSSNLY